MKSIELTSITGITPPFVVEVCNVFIENCVFIYQSPPSITVPPNIYFNSLPIIFETAPVVLLKITDSRGCVVTQVKYCVENIVPPLYPYCDNCGSVEGFVSNTFGDGYYADDFSPYLYLYSSGTFGNLLEQESVGTMPTAAAGTSRAYTNGKMFVSYGIPFPSSSADTGIVVFDSGGTLVTTFTLGAVAVGGISYDSSVNKIFFTYNPPPYSDRRIGYFDPNTYSITLDVAANWSAGFYFPGGIKTNPITYEKYVKTSDGYFYIFGAGTTSPIPLKKTLTGATYTFFFSFGGQPLSNVFNTQTGEFWMTTPRTGSTQDIVIVEPYTYALTVVNQSCLGTSYRVNDAYQAITYYPGDGSPNSSKMFVVYRNNAGTNYKIVQFDTSPPYNNSIFYNIPGVTSQQNLIYSSVYSKLIHNSGGNINAFDPTSSVVDYCPTLTSIYTMSQPLEDIDSKQIFYLTSINNVFWLGLNEVNAIECQEKVIDYYSTNQGPYKFNVTTLNWESMCTTNVSYNTPTTNKFTIDAQIGNFATEAYLSYSSTSVNNWTPIPNIAGDVVISAISWNTGLIYDDPDSSFILRVTFVSGSCELYGPVI